MNQRSNNTQLLVVIIVNYAVYNNISVLSNIGLSVMKHHKVYGEVFLFHRFVGSKGAGHILIFSTVSNGRVNSCFIH